MATEQHVIELLEVALQRLSRIEEAVSAHQQTIAAIQVYLEYLLTGAKSLNTAVASLPCDKVLSKVKEGGN